MAMPATIAHAHLPDRNTLSCLHASPEESSAALTRDQSPLLKIFRMRPRRVAADAGRPAGEDRRRAVLTSEYNWWAIPGSNQ
jgi:hypothetical protein